MIYKKEANAGLYQLLKNGVVMFQCYEHTKQIFIDNLLSKVYQFA
jgi:hypothetical protein